jgi:ferredoxin
MHDGDLATKRLIDEGGLQALIDGLRARDYTVLGPRVRDGAIVYDEIAAVAELPRGWTDRQAAGRYRLERRADEALFGYANGADSWKRRLHPPVEPLFRLHRDGAGFRPAEEAQVPPPRYAFLGARACDLAAIAIQDRVFASGPIGDAAYARRRDGAFIVAVDCAEPGGTCFCARLGTGPKARARFDLALTELLDGPHRFLVEVGSERGGALVAALDSRPATAADVAAAAGVEARCTAAQSRGFDPAGAARVLRDSPDHPHWDEVAARCLSCANCTMVCPTCFCTTIVDSGDLRGNSAARERRWDSCFTLDFSHLHGGSVRASTRSRYRQWLTHKLSTWIEQFGVPGCVGCGRCVTWCPAGIDLVAEVAALSAPRCGAAAAQ